ncbi:MAG: SurA N-terminal domain-containing protein [Sulfuricellaceae bacterium]|nr:SurA N-terminal domain-containing protein [Sulfuricellaceae bacterium]
MLEAIRDRAQGWIAKLILVLISVPFVLFGIDSYFRNTGDEGVVATVGKEKIKREELTQSLRDVEAQIRMPANAAIRTAVLQGLVDQRVLQQQAKKEGMFVPENLAAEILAGVPAFQEDGRFSAQRFEAWLSQQGKNAAQFERELKGKILIRQLNGALQQSAALPLSAVDNFIRADEQLRIVSVATLTADAFLPGVQVDDAAAKRYYDAHPQEFIEPARAKVDYLVLSQNDLMQQITVDDSEMKTYYKEHLNHYQTPEERRASHILISVAATATEAQKAAARHKAEALLQQVRKNPKDFADLARKNSQDTGSAEKGGDLGMFGRGAMVRPFEDAVFSMKKGEISDLVQTPFGFHIIQLTDIHPGRTRSFDEVKNEIQAELKKQLAGKKFAELADSFGNMVYEQGDSLNPAADALKLTIQHSDWLERKNAGGGMLDNAKLLEAIFSDDVLKNRRNTEAIEVTPNTLVSARIADYKPSGLRPYADVKAALVQRLRREQALNLAVKQGNEWLASLRQGKPVSGPSWGGGRELSRSKQADGFPAALLESVFRADTRSLPSYVGQATDKGFTLVKITGVKDAPQPDDAKRKSYAKELQAMLAREFIRSYVQSVRQRSEISIKQSALAKTEQEP